MRIRTLLIAALLTAVACGSESASPTPPQEGFGLGETVPITYHAETTHSVTFLTSTESNIAVLNYSSGPYTFTALPGRKFVVVTFKFRNDSIRPLETPYLRGIAVADRGFEFPSWSPPGGANSEEYLARPSTEEEVAAIPPDAQAYVKLFPEAESGIGAMIFEIPAEEQVVSVYTGYVDQPLLLK